MTEFEPVVCDGQVVLDGGKVVEADVGVRDGRIAAISPAPLKGSQRLDAAGCWVPGVVDGTSTSSTASFFVWATLPGAADAAALLPRAEAAGVGYVPDARFGLPGAPVPHSSLRLVFCAHPAETLHEGARRLGQAFARPAAEAS